MKVTNCKKVVFLLIIFLGIYLVIWLIKGQPLLSKIGDDWKYTYSSVLNIDDRDFEKSDVEKIQRFEWVEKVNIDLWRSSDLECISSMKRLKTILIGINGSNSVVDWNGISNCINVENVYISGGELQNLSCFSNLKMLKFLGLEWAKEGATIDLKNISELSSLEYLIIEGYTIRNAEELSKVHTLKSVIVKGKAENLILSCPVENLEILNYSAYGESKFDASDFLKFKKLKQLSIYNAHIDNITLLNDLEYLEELRLDVELYSDEELLSLKNNGICVN